jgi:glycine/D-amino acid oxidase-like deaminating enzyme
VKRRTCAPQHIGTAGAGLLGRWLARQLVRAGHRVEVHDPAEGPEQRGTAGWTAAGMVSPLAELEPALRGGLHAWMLPGEGRIHTVQAMMALLAAGQGASWRSRVHEVAP